MQKFNPDPGSSRGTRAVQSDQGGRARGPQVSLPTPRKKRARGGGSLAAHSCGGTRPDMPSPWSQDLPPRQGLTGRRQRGGTPRSPPGQWVSAQQFPPAIPLPLARLAFQAHVSSGPSQVGTDGQHHQSGQAQKFQKGSPRARAVWADSAWPCPGRGGALRGLRRGDPKPSPGTLQQPPLTWGRSPARGVHRPGPHSPCATSPTSPMATCVSPPCLVSCAHAVHCHPPQDPHCTDAGHTLPCPPCVTPFRLPVPTARSLGNAVLGVHGSATPGTPGHLRSEEYTLPGRAATLQNAHHTPARPVLVK